ncbi:I78 family peptidase inhibitor [Lysobacter claricitrinus]|uniref:I78 family peptidase inhibitor n=1 Tax=Lysobacter claricitrinus TaxID=3367728 RepID=UPI0037DAF82A
MNPIVRTTTLLSLVALAACSTTSSTPPMSDPMPPVTAQCHADAAQSLVGQSATPQNVETARQRAGAQMARVLKPDQAVTMEYREGRLNIYVDAANVITRIACG